MDITSWKRYKRSGTFRRRVQKTYESFKNRPDSVASVNENNIGQECAPDNLNGSVQFFSTKSEES